MTKQKSIPGLHESGMFFEYYVFEPRSNFKEEDLHHVLRYFDIKFEDESLIPVNVRQHFEGLVFKPTDKLTANEFADILKAMKIKLGSEKLLTRLPKTVQEHFNEELVFDPYDDFSLSDLNEFLLKFIHFRITTKQFNALPRNVKREFIVFTRDGKTWRYGDRRPT